MKNKSDIHSVVFLGDYPLNERYAFLKRHKLKAIQKKLKHTQMMDILGTST